MCAPAGRLLVCVPPLCRYWLQGCDKSGLGWSWGRPTPPAASVCWCRRTSWPSPSPDRYWTHWWTEKWFGNNEPQRHTHKNFNRAEEKWADSCSLEHVGVHRSRRDVEVRGLNSLRCWCEICREREIGSLLWKYLNIYYILRHPVCVADCVERTNKIKEKNLICLVYIWFCTDVTLIQLHVRKYFVCNKFDFLLQGFDHFLCSVHCFHIRSMLQFTCR